MIDRKSRTLDGKMAADGAHKGRRRLTTLVEEAALFFVTESKAYASW